MSRSLPLAIVSFCLLVATSFAVSWTSIDDPNAQRGTVAYDINTTGAIVGYWFDFQVHAHGFVDVNGTFSDFDVPGATSTFAYGINDSGQTVGLYLDARSFFHGFFFDGSTYQTIDFPGAMNSYVTKINNSQQMVGYYQDQSGAEFTFEYDASTGIFTTLQPPRQLALYPGGINNLGEIAGFAEPPTGNGNGYLESNGSFRFLAVPNAVTTQPQDVNDGDEIVGYLISQKAKHKGFIYTHGNSLVLDYPGGTGYTLAFGVNNAGDVVGQWVDSLNNPRGFLRTP